MSQHQLPATLTVADVVVANLQPHRFSIQKTMSELFERSERKRAMMAVARQETKVKETRQVLFDHFNLDPLSIRMAEQIEPLTPQRRSKVLTEFMFIVDARGQAGDVVYEEEPETGPMYDRTRMGQRQGGGKFGPQGVRADRRESNSVTRTKLNLRMGEEMLARGRQGLKMRDRVGRPSNEERFAEAWAMEKLEAELERERLQNAPGLIEHQPAPPEDQQDGPQAPEGE